MNTPPTTAFERFVTILALILAVASTDCYARPEFYLRPIAQFTYLPKVNRKSDLSHSENNIAYGMFTGIKSHDYTTNSSSNLAAGIAAGLTLGNSRNVELGLELSQTRYDGTYQTTGGTFSYSPSGSTPPVDVFIPSSTQTCSFKVQTFVATFRRYLRNRENRVRPHINFAAGAFNYTVTETTRPVGYRDIWYDENKGGFALGLGGGVNIKLGKYASVDVSYRLTHADSGFFVTHDEFYRLAHIFNLGLDLRY